METAMTQATTTSPTSPQARAERLKRLRNLANLCRKDLCEGSKINLNTLIGWEVARHGGLSRIGAERVIERVAKEGVFCSIEWLLDGRAEPPRVATDLKTPTNICNTEKTTLSDADKARAELQFFKSLHPETISYKISDETMLPRFTPGDLVAGVTHPSDQYDELKNQICIVELESGEKLLRQLKYCNSTQTFYLLCTNQDAAPAKLMIKKPTIKHIAKVVWHRRAS
jgi:hypothetical protein